MQNFDNATLKGNKGIKSYFCNLTTESLYCTTDKRYQYLQVFFSDPNAFSALAR